MSKTQYTTVSALILYVTDRAALIVPDELDEERWVPLSVIEDGDSLDADFDDLQDLRIATWFCDKEGIS